jgi:hypothetical protein
MKSSPTCKRGGHVSPINLDDCVRLPVVPKPEPEPLQGILFATGPGTICTR